ncbi:hypothetical protein [Planomicrobium sp. YIM 101495]|uniref:hypothetical protein n=1 Tax=Planomicrobium sp. YIM 101495 TaxID=2665160 RepID=UPI0012B93D68|nr:hypothetical protein [Planomicrobium sp. YIM 101495]MTD29802.1 hypothetical protein [Planomicrobium sp. YIM 101495]
MEVYLVFTDTKTVLSRLIKSYTGQQFSHVSIAFDRELQEMYSFGRKDVRNAFIGGFVKEDASSPFFQRANCAVYRLPVSRNAFARMRETIHNMEAREEHLKYNISGLFGILLNRSFEREDAYFCSHFVGEILQDGGFYISNKPIHLTMPRDLFVLPQLEFAYSGRLSNYQYLKKETSFDGNSTTMNFLYEHRQRTF